MQVETTYLKRSLRDMNEFLMLTYARSKYVESAPSVLILIFPITFVHHFSDGFVARPWKDPPTPSLCKPW